jgi:hypothetical protein
LADLELLVPVDIKRETTIKSQLLRWGQESEMIDKRDEIVSFLKGRIIQGRKDDALFNNVCYEWLLSFTHDCRRR